MGLRHTVDGLRLRVLRCGSIKQLRDLPRSVQRARSSTALLKLRVDRIEGLLTPNAAESVGRVADALRPVPSRHDFRRIGAENDGGYVIAADLGCPTAVVSIGVGPECSADVELAKWGARVFQFDHTVNRSPSTHANIQFFPIGLGNRPSDLTQPLDDLVRIAGIEEGTDAWLMIDAEGVEWDLLRFQAEAVSRFSQISIEFHLLSLLSDESAAGVMATCVEKLRSSHVPVAWHVNNFAPVHAIGGFWVPDVIEVSFVHSSRFRPGDALPNAALFSQNNPVGPKVVEPFSPASLSPLGSMPEALSS